MDKVIQLVDNGVNWSADRYARLRVWSLVGWSLAATMLLLFLIAVAGGYRVWERMARPIPPVVLSVDHATGEVQALPVWNALAESQLILLHKFFVKQYVERREGYLYEQLNNDFHLVDEQSFGQAKDTYDALFSGANARHKTLLSNQRWLVDVSSIQMPPDSPGIAIVRFSRRVVTVGQGEAVSYYTARLSYNFKGSGQILSERQLVSNPVGFVVTSYVLDADLSHDNAPAPGSVAAGPASTDTSSQLKREQTQQSGGIQ